MKYWAKLIVIIILSFSSSAKAEFEWITYTLDNDLFLGNDSGYTNGLYIALYDTKEKDSLPKPSWMLKPLEWTISKEGSLASINSYTIGQSMFTPEDITIANPGADDLPYSGLLFLNNSYLVVNDTFADKIGTTLGIVGPSSFAEDAQKLVHKAIGADDPLGWDTQLEDELVFQFERSRAWRTWVSDNERWDLVTSAELSLGTLSSSVATGLMIRYGSGLKGSYASNLFIKTRTTNPLSFDGHWNVYIGINAGYQFNMIFLDGNTFRNGRSIDYKQESIGTTLGFSYSWNEYSFAFALNDLNILSEESEEQLEGLTQYGTLTFAVKF